MMNLSFKLAIATVLTLPLAIATPHPAVSNLASSAETTSPETEVAQIKLPSIEIPQIEIRTRRSDLSDAQLAPYVEGYAELVFQNYRDSHQQAMMMGKAIEQFLAQPNASTHAAAKRAWVEARQSYLQTEAFRFYEGPIDFVDTTTGKEGPEGRINAWPMNEAFIDYVKGNPSSGIINNKSLDVSLKTIIDNDQVSDEADVTTGWHAIEFLLWGQDFNPTGPGQRSYQDFVAGQGNNERRRTYLKLVTQQLLEDLSFLENEWKPNASNYRATFVQQDLKETLGKIFTSLATLSAFEMSSERMAVALDSGNQEDEHSCFSDTTHQDFVFNAQGIENVYRGNYGNYDGPGFDELVNQLDPNMNQTILVALGETRERIANINAPFDQVLASNDQSFGRSETELAITALEDQAEAFVALGSVLGIDVEILAE